MKKSNAEVLMAKLRSGSCTPEEKRLIDSMFLEMPLADLPEVSDEDYEKWKIAAWDNLSAQLEVNAARRIIRLRKRRAYAAVGVLLLLLSTWAVVETWPTAESSLYTIISAEEITPATDQAVLKLADGTPIVLSNAHRGIVIGQDIRYSDGSSLPVDNRSLSQKMVLKTPKGRTYQIELPDGSLVQLNAASTLIYPGKFDTDERMVELRGEAFFSVNQLTDPDPHDGNGAVPFKVVSPGQVVEVLGTAFNLSAYPDDPFTRTTLVEGKVSVHTLNGNIHLDPGEQSLASDGHLGKAAVDVTQYISWTRGYFRLSADLETILAEVSRWYDIEVEFMDPTLKEARASIIVLKDKPLSVVLSMLEEVTPARFVVREEKAKLSNDRRERRLRVMR